MLQAFEKGHQIEVFFNLKQKFNTRKTLKDPLMSITLLTTEVRNGSPFLISPEPLIVFKWHCSNLNAIFINWDPFF